jgi:hypothetical protein
MHESMSIKFMLSTMNPTQNMLGLNPVLYGKKIVAKCLSHGMDYQASITVMQKTRFSFRELHQTLDIHLTCILYCNDNCTMLTLTTESQTYILLTANNYSHLPHYLTHSFRPLVISYQLAHDRMLHSKKK